MKAFVPFFCSLAMAMAVAVTQAQTWETVGQNPFPDDPNGGCSIVATAGGGVYCLVGRTLDDGRSVRYVERSLDQGTTWLTMSDELDLVSHLAPYLLTDFTNDTPLNGGLSVAANLLGNIFTIGSYREPTNGENANAALIRRLPVVVAP